MRKSKNKRVIPGFGLSFGITITMLGLIVIIPLCSLVVFSAKLSFPEFLDTITRPRVLSSYAVSFFTAFVAAANIRADGSSRVAKSSRVKPRSRH